MPEESRVAIVTGAARGIGRAIGRKMVESGWRVVLADIDEQAAQKTAGALGGSGDSLFSYKVDVSDQTGVSGLIGATVNAFGKLDVFVNNAGIMNRAPFLEMTEPFWHHVIDTNLTGAFLCGQAAARQMIAQGTGGRIVNITSNSGIFGGRGRTAYGASKAGLVNLTQTMAIELAEHGILVNAVAPGPTKTSDKQPDSPWPSVAARMPLGRWGQPEEIAEVVMFLASDRCSFTTGHVWCADGGYTVSGIMEG